MPYRRSSYVKYSQSNRSATTGKGRVVTKPKGPTGGNDGDPVFTINATAGEPTSATISGTYPNFHIELVIKEGTDGTDGTDGTNGYCECNCECCNGGGGEEPPPCEDSSLHAGEEGWTYDGCHWSWSQPP